MNRKMIDRETRSMQELGPEGRETVQRYYYDQYFTVFGAAIQSTVRRVNLDPSLVADLTRLARNYFDSLFRYREQFPKVVDTLAETYSSLDTLDIWNPDDFVLWTPQELHETVMGSADREHTQTNDEQGQVEYDLGNVADQGERERLEARLEDIRTKGAMLFHKRHYSSIFDDPLYIIVAGYEGFILQRGDFDRDAYLATYDYFDAPGEQEVQSYVLIEDEFADDPKELQRARDEFGVLQEKMRVYIGQLKQAAGNIPEMGKIVKEHLDMNFPGNGRYVNPRQFFIDPFEMNLPDLTFPSAQADFIAARLVACSMFGEENEE